MNGLKFIRTRCNYSQAALAEKLGVSRQAINMWENSKKPLSELRKNELKEFFGLETGEWFGEIDDGNVAEIKKLPMYIKHGGVSEHFLFSPQTGIGQLKIGFQNTSQNELSLDERCTLKRHELSELFAEVQNYINDNEIKNSTKSLSRMNTVQKVFGGIFDALQSIGTKSPVERMVYIFTIFTVINAINVSFGNAKIEDAEAICKEQLELYDYTLLLRNITHQVETHLEDYTKKVNAKAEKLKKVKF